MSWGKPFQRNKVFNVLEDVGSGKAKAVNEHHLSKKKSEENEEHKQTGLRCTVLFSQLLERLARGQEKHKASLEYDGSPVSPKETWWDPFLKYKVKRNPGM